MALDAWFWVMMGILAGIYGIYHGEKKRQEKEPAVTGASFGTHR